MLTPHPLTTALLADGPDPAYTAQLAYFGRFAGAWQIDNHLRADDGTWSTHPGTWTFGWILGGRAIQDVLYCPGLDNRYPGTTVRCYEPATDSWRVNWHDPYSGLHATLTTARQDGDLVMTGTTHTGSALHWRFYDIEPGSFRWQGRYGATEADLELRQEMSAHR